MFRGLVSFGLALLLGGAGAACQDPSGSALPSASAVPGDGATPIAPAIEPGTPRPDPTIQLPASLEPVAPAIEPGTPAPDPMISFDPG